MFSVLTARTECRENGILRDGENDIYLCFYFTLNVIIKNNRAKICTNGDKILCLGLKYVISNLGVKSVLET